MQNKKTSKTSNEHIRTHPFCHHLPCPPLHTIVADTLRAEWQCVVYATQNLARRKWIHLGYKCMTNTHMHTHADTHTQACMCSRQNMITIKTLYTWRIYIIHFGVGSSCHIRNRCRFVSLSICLCFSLFLNLCMCVCFVTVFLCFVLDQAGFVLNKYQQTTPKNTKKQKEK